MFQRLFRKNNKKDSQPATKQKDSEAPKALFLEDTAESRRLFPRMLRRLGYQVFNESDPELSIELASSKQPDVIFIDLYLPGIDGFMVAKILKSDPKTAHIPLIALVVSYESTEIKLLNFDYFIFKPIYFTELRHLLRQLNQVQIKMNPKIQFPKMNAKKAIIIGDNSHQAHDLLSRLITRLGYATHRDYEFSDVVEWMKEHKSALIIIDQQLEQSLKDSAVYLHLKTNNTLPKAPIIVLARTEEFGAEFEGIANVILSKPLSFRDLKDTVKELTKKIIIIGDNIQARDMIIKKLIRKGFETERIENIFDALRSIKNDPPDLIIMEPEEIYHSDRDALNSAYKELRDVKTSNKLPILALHGDREIPPEHQIIFNAMFKKPVDFPDFLEAINSLIK